MGKIAVIICNFNKASMVVKCIQCILESTFRDFDIFVVDNASTDNSVEAICRSYSNDVTVLQNSENLGGTGGFNTGLKHAYELGYEYFMCVDNDAFLDENAIKELYDFMEAHPKAGIATSKIYHMDAPGYIQQYGQEISFDFFATTPLDYNKYDDGSLEAFRYVDAAAACSMLIRRSLIDKIGFWNDDYFLYWDDTDFCWRCWLAGMEVASVGTSYALHQMGAKKEAVSTFPTYYSWRNWIYFFKKYTAKEDSKRMGKEMLSYIFEAVYRDSYNGESAISQTVLFAYHDAIAGNMGKALENRISPIKRNFGPLEKLFKSHKRIYIEPNNYLELASNIKDFAKLYNPSIEFVDSPGPNATTIELCQSVFLVSDLTLTKVYIDADLCVFSTKEDLEKIKAYIPSQNAFVHDHLEEFLGH